MTLLRDEYARLRTVRLFLLNFASAWLTIRTMAYQKVNRPPNAVPDSVAWKALGLSRATFFRKLKEGSLSEPITRSGTARRWWTPSDIEMARQELEPNSVGAKYGD